MVNITSNGIKDFGKEQAGHERQVSSRHDDIKKIDDI